MARILNMVLLLVATLMAVVAYDDRVDFKPKSGQTPAEFCKKWPSKCKSVARKHHAPGKLYFVCELGPRPGLAEAYCDMLDGTKRFQYADEVGRDLGATQV
ncbi:hypothetical protein DM01DRAFT_1331803 [Hesseltinella vesiculosa]|uniref:Uncharacterized protein n=1 Tax=Hesseltinella vesiculosa TaxID=101127 RepID=A0A1X2GWG4_9FUNG|nr:hypothetical protein DM01DRAFT_1331803 [Hesseltinella vesiculosa]